MMVQPPPSPYYGDTAFALFMPMATAYTIIANLVASILRPPKLFPTVQALPLLPMMWPSEKTPRLAIVTGSNTGIGLETSKALVHRGWNVILACRSREKALQAVEQINAATAQGVGGRALFVGELDLTNPQSIDDFCIQVKTKYSKVDVLINNAGRNTSGPTENGLDVCFMTNFLGHFILTQRLLGVMAKGTGGKIINVSSVMHHFCDIPADELSSTEYWKRVATYGVVPDNTYAASKLAALLFSIELNRRYFKSRNLRAITVNPGAV